MQVIHSSHRYQQKSIGIPLNVFHVSVPATVYCDDIQALDINKYCKLKGNDIGRFHFRVVSFYKLVWCF